METNKIIFEHQIRKVIREELLKVLNEQGVVNEGIFSKIVKPALFAAIMTLSGHTVAARGGSGGGDESGGKTIQQVLEDAGLTEKVLSELEVGLTQEDIKILNRLFQQEKNYELQAKKAQLKGDTEEAEKLQTKSNRVLVDYLTRNPEAEERFMKTGVAIHQYLRSLPPDAFEEMGDPKEEEALKAIQSKALSYQIKPATQSKNLSTAFINDINNLVLKAGNESGYSPDKQETIINWIVGKNELFDKLPNNFDLSDVVKVANEQGIIDSQLYNPENFTQRRVTEFSNTLTDISKDQAKAIYFDVADNMQNENKINKLRSRLNELRGRYV